MFEPEHMEDECCDGCGVKPARHMGHGSFSCKKCFDAQWCPNCTYQLHSYIQNGVHVCPTGNLTIDDKIAEYNRTHDDTHSMGRHRESGEQVTATPKLCECGKCPLCGSDCPSKESEE